MSRAVLIVDDDEDIRESLRDIVRDQGYATLTAVDGADALRLLRSPEQPTPSLILLDLNMPNVDGVAFLELQRQDVRLAAIPVIVVSADPRPRVTGAPVLRKPFDTSKLLEAIRSAVR